MFINTPLINIVDSNKAKLTTIQKNFPNYNYKNFNPVTDQENLEFNEDLIRKVYDKARRVNIKGKNCAVAFETGYFHIKDKGYFLVDVCCLKDPEGYRFGCGVFYEISANMYRCAKKGFNLNKLMDAIIKRENLEFKLQPSVSSFLMGEKYTRSVGFDVALKNAIKCEYSPKYNPSVIFKTKAVKVTTKTENFKKLDSECEEILSKNL